MASISGRYEIRQAQWVVVVGTASSSPPASCISWIVLEESLLRLKSVAGEELNRLPTKAGWEYGLPGA